MSLKNILVSTIKTKNADLEPKHKIKFSLDLPNKLNTNFNVFMTLHHFTHSK